MPAVTDQKINALMKRAQNILKTPQTEWDKIAVETPTLKDLLLNYVAYFAAIPAVCTFVGLVLFGYGFNLRPTILAAFSHMVLTYVMAFVGIAVSGFLTDFFAPHFNGRSDRVSAFKLVTYSMTAAWLAAAFNILPPMLRVLSILGVYSVYLFYLGAPKLMKVPADKTVAYTAITIVCSAVVAGVIAAIMLRT